MQRWICSKRFAKYLLKKQRCVNNACLTSMSFSIILNYSTFEKYMSLSWYPCNRLDTLQYVKSTKWNNAAKGMTLFKTLKAVQNNNKTHKTHTHTTPYPTLGIEPDTSSMPPRQVILIHEVMLFNLINVLHRHTVHKSKTLFALMLWN